MAGYTLNLLHRFRARTRGSRLTRYSRMLAQRTAAPPEPDRFSAPVTVINKGTHTEKVHYDFPEALHRDNEKERRLHPCKSTPVEVISYGK